MRGRTAAAAALSVFILLASTALAQEPPQQVFTLSAFDKTYSLRLAESPDFFHPNLRIEVDGVALAKLPARPMQGAVLDSTNRAVGSAKIIVLADGGAFSGTFSDLGSTYVVSHNGTATEVGGGEAVRSCGVDSEANVDREGVYMRFVEKNKKRLEAFFGGGSAGVQIEKRAAAAGCLGTRKVLYMGVAADCSYVKRAGGTEEAITKIIQNWNSASKIYEDEFNIALGIIKIKVFSNCGEFPWNVECSTGYTLQKRLSDFSKWRGTLGADGAGLWHLMSNCPSGGGNIGSAWIQMLCNTNAFQQGSGPNAEFVSGTGVSTAGRREWLVVAHEIGHNFGSQHDCTSGECPCRGIGGCSCCQCDGCDCKAQYIMHPSDDSIQRRFSDCSRTNICKTVRTAGNCLKEPGSLVTIEQGRCGNRIKEAGEECDCGTESDCANNPCCDWKTCKLKPGAKCSDSNDGCCENCQVRAAGYACRPVRGVCDVQETCDGQSGVCPKDEFLPDGDTCITEDKRKAQCASGFCTSRDIQCQDLSGARGLGEACKPYEYDCRVLCQSGALECTDLTGFFIDGTTCGWLSRCYGGECTSPNALIGWANKNKTWAISLFVLANILLVAGTVFCCRRLARRAAARKPAVRRGVGSNAARGGVTPSMQQQRRASALNPSRRASILPQNVNDTVKEVDGNIIANDDDTPTYYPSRSEDTIAPGVSETAAASSDAKPN